MGVTICHLINSLHKLQCTEDAACHRTWVTGLFRLQHRALPALVFAPAGRGLGPERGSHRGYSLIVGVSKKPGKYRETRTVSKPAERGLVSAMYLIHGNIIASP
jgi:hypothetical protein